MNKQKKKKLTYVNVGLLPEEYRTLQSLKHKHKRRTVTDTLRFLIINESEKFFAKNIANSISGTNDHEAAI